MSLDRAPCLIVDGAQPRRIVLARNEMTLGRSPDADIHVDSPEVSRAHARFTRREDGVLLTDLGSSNGTFVNGSRLEGPVMLNDGDRLAFARMHATFRTVPEPGATPWPPAAPPRPVGAPMKGALPGALSAPPPPGAVQTTWPVPTSPQPGPPPPAQSAAGRAPAPGPVTGPAGSPLRPAAPGPVAGRAPAPRAALEQVSGAPVLLTQHETTIGRAAGNDVILSDTYVSSRHARILQQGGQFILIDDKSANGTYLNGRLVTEPCVLEPGDEIRVGETTFNFRRLAPVSRRRPKVGPTGPRDSAKPQPPKRS